VFATRHAATTVIGVSGAVGVVTVLAVAAIWPHAQKPADQQKQAGQTANGSPPHGGQAEAHGGQPGTGGGQSGQPASASSRSSGGQPGRGGTAPDSSPGPSR
jgi:hypothetical protein